MSTTPIEQMLDELEYKSVEPTHNDTAIPYVTHEAILKIGEIELRVYQLNNGMRVIDGEDAEKLFSSLMNENQ